MIDIVAALESSFDEIHYLDFYREIFPEGSFEEKGVYEDGKYNGIAVAIEKGGKRTKRLTVTDDLDAIADMAASDDFCLMSPISYIGKSRKSSNARLMYALAIDLDGIEERQQWEFFMEQIDRGHEMLKFVWGLPRPTYLISSGTGIHIYYVFQQPIPMFKNIVEQLEKLKKRLTWQAWTQGASSLHEKVQYESLFQGFRVVGTITKAKDGGRCRAFRTGEKVTVEYLNRFVPEEYRAKNFVYKSDLHLEDAKKKYPEWYEKRVVHKEPKGHWICKRDLYDWWKRKIRAEAVVGHRYYCLMMLAIYAVKCDIDRAELEEDCMELMEVFEERTDREDNHFTEKDVLDALQSFEDKGLITYPVNSIANRSGIAIPRNKRNYRKQEVHVKYMNNQRAFKVELGECTNGGRPSQEQTVREWQELHPDGKKADCIRETGLAKHTVYKWWQKGAAGYEDDKTDR